VVSLDHSVPVGSSRSWGFLAGLSLAPAAPHLLDPTLLTWAHAGLGLCCGNECRAKKGCESERPVTSQGR
jgi:hypothetical protein